MIFDTIKHELIEKAAPRRSAVSGTCQFPAKSWLIAGESAVMIPVEERFDYSLAFVLHKIWKRDWKLCMVFQGGGVNTDGPPSHTRA